MKKLRVGDCVILERAVRYGERDKHKWVRVSYVGRKYFHVEDPKYPSIYRGVRFLISTGLSDSYYYRRAYPDVDSLRDSMIMDCARTVLRKEGIDIMRSSTITKEQLRALLGVFTEAEKEVQKKIQEVVDNIQPLEV